MRREDAWVLLRGREGSFAIGRGCSLGPCSSSDAIAFPLPFAVVVALAGTDSGTSIPSDMDSSSLSMAVLSWRREMFVVKCDLRGMFATSERATRG